MLSSCTRDRLVLLSWGQELLDPPKDSRSELLEAVLKSAGHDGRSPKVWMFFFGNLAVAVLVHVSIRR